MAGANGEEGVKFLRLGLGVLGSVASENTRHIPQPWGQTGSALCAY